MSLKEEMVAPMAVWLNLQVLLTERHELPGGLEVSSLHGPGGTEGPAAAAVGLVLHLSHVALSSPVHGLVQLGQLRLRHHHQSVLLGVSVGYKTIHPLLDLVRRQVGQLVLPDVEGVFSSLELSVMLGDHFHRGGPDTLAVDLVLLATIFLVVFQLELLPGVGVVRVGQGQDDAGHQYEDGGEDCSHCNDKSTLPM